MSSLNKTLLIGNITKDPEIRQTQGGNFVASFGLATNRVWKNTSGEKQEAVEFHNIVLWSRLAEIARDYLKKGNKVYIDGRLQTRNYEDKEGIKRYRTEIIGENLIMLGSPHSKQSEIIEKLSEENIEEEVIEEEIMPENVKKVGKKKVKIALEEIPF